MKSLLVGIAGLFLFLAASVAGEAPIEAKITRLIASPAELRGRRITVTGYYYANFEHSALYPDRKEVSRVDDNLPKKRSIWIDFIGRDEQNAKFDRVNEGWVQVTGTFQYHPNPDGISGFGHIGEWRMQLTDLTAFKRIRTQTKR